VVAFLSDNQLDSDVAVESLGLSLITLSRRDRTEC
jgi:hypothetical protein